MGRISAFAFTMVLAGAFAEPALAYVPTITASGTPVRWRGNAKLNLAGNPINRSGIDPGSFNASVVKSLQRWNKASGGRVGFDYWQGTDRAIYEPDSGYNGLSSIYFASNAKSDPHLSSNVLGLTQVWYNTDTGEILETDVVLNDRDFHFTTDPRDTSGSGSSAGPSYSSGRNNVFIENVLTHELGHAYGLSHSGGLQSTMLFMESPEQAHLGCDDSVAIRALYPTYDAGSRGAITGVVVSEAGQPVFGAHVLAISRRRGTVLATGMTDKSGRYKIAALEAGTYFLMAEPFFAGTSALPSYYSGADSNICPGGQTFGRSLLMGAGVSPVGITVGGGGAVNAANLVVHCSGSGGAALTMSLTASLSSSAAVVYDGSRDGSGFGVVDRFGSGNSVFYRLRAVSGHVEIHALSYSLYSPIRPTLALQDSSGAPVSGVQIQDSVYAGDSGYVNYDSALVADGLPNGEYLVEVSGTAMESSRYPAGPVSLDTVPFLVLTGSVNEGSPASASEIPVNARCRMDESFAAYSSPGGNPPRRSTDDADSGGTGFCGTLARNSDGSSGGGGDGPTPGAMAGWLLPWAAMALIARMAQTMARNQRRRPQLG